MKCHWKAVALLTGLSLAGCGGESGSPTNAANSASTGTASTPASSAEKSSETVAGNGTTNAPPAAAINVPAPESLPTDVVRPKEGTPEWIILQITQLKLQPYPQTDDVNAQRAARRERNLKLIELAEEAIAKTHQVPEKELVFNAAVHHLMEAAMQLAMTGEQESVDYLYEQAELLYQRDPKSRSAAEASFFVARFANENAARYASKDIRWLQEFARQARSFADRFPQDQQRAVALLNDAGISCDAWGLQDEAIQCYSAIRQKYPESPQAEQALASIRRLGLIGKPLDLGGPTSDGGFTSIADFKGAPVLVVFWSTQAAPFVEQAKAIIETVSKYEDKGLQVIGVNLDTDESAVDAFADKTGINWRTIFHIDAAKRGWNNPVAVHYGVRNIPQFWLIDREGKVLTTTLQPKDLEITLAKAVSATPSTIANKKSGETSAAATPTTEIRPASASTSAKPASPAATKKAATNN